MRKVTSLEDVAVFLGGAPCTNRETAAEKAAAHAWMAKERARRPTKARARFLQTAGKMLEDLRRER